MTTLFRHGRVHDGRPVLRDDTDLPVLCRLLAGGRTIHDRETA